MSDKSQVFFTDLRAKPGKNLLDKLERLIKKAGISTIDFEKQFTAIKIHFGETGNLAYIRPNYAAKVVEVVQSLGGRVFVTDSNTLYSGSRANAIDHLETASRNGFNRLVLGCDVIIADGIKGTDYREVEVNQKNCDKVKIGAAIADADIIISMNHFKGHEMTGFGGALKNLGMGSGSRGGKLEMHSASKPEIKLEDCTGCRHCIAACAQDAISLNADKKAVIDYDLCVGCGQCVAVCQYGAAIIDWDEAGETAAEKIAEYTLGVLKDKQQFHINFLMNISPDCDCWGYNDTPLVADIGILASFDPVALDQACSDLVKAAPALPGNILADKGFKDGEDKFQCVHGNIDHQKNLSYAASIGLGTTEYEIIEVK